MARLLPNDTLRGLHKVVLDLSLGRDALIQGIDAGYWRSLPVLDTEAATVYSDLLRMNQDGPLADGTLPLREWLLTALHFAELRSSPRAAELQQVLAQVDRALIDAAAPPLPGLPGVSPEAEDALRRLLHILFTADELRRLVRYLPHGDELSAALPGATASAAAVTQAVAELLCRRDEANAAFFDRLERERPGQRARIAEVRGRFGV